MSLLQQNSRTKLRVIANIAYSTVGFLASIITLATIFSTLSIATLVAWLTQQNNLLLPLASFTLGFCLSLIIIAIFLLVFSKSIFIRELSRGYRWVSADHLYCVDDTLEQHLQVSTITIRITRPGTIIFEDFYTWSGHGKEEPPEVLSVGHELMGSVTKQRFYFKQRETKYYYIYLGRELLVGKEVEVKIKKTLYDNARRFEPFFSTTLGRPLRSLKLCVRLPKTPHAMNCYNYHYARSGGKSKLISKIPSILTVNPDNIELSYEILNTQPDQYEIRWEW